MRGFGLQASGFRSEAHRQRTPYRSYSGPKPIRIEVTRTVSGWAPSNGDLTAWALAALGRKARGRELAIRLVAPRESRALNARYRRRNKPTNVLSFPAAGAASAGVLGDLVICPAVLRGEARDQGKSVRAHWAHLVVHGTLHLIGYDHGRTRDAQRMERREIAVLRRLGFANPYRESA
jgi:probable rRNA maturation factor